MGQKGPNDVSTTPLATSLISCLHHPLVLIRIHLCVSEGPILDSVVSEVNPSTALELGTYCGYSTVRIARLLSPGSKLITVEFNPAYAAIARQIIAHAGLQNKVREKTSGRYMRYNVQNDMLYTRKKCAVQLESSYRLENVYIYTFAI